MTLNNGQRVTFRHGQRPPAVRPDSHHRHVQLAGGRELHHHRHRHVDLHRHQHRHPDRRPLREERTAVDLPVRHQGVAGHRHQRMLGQANVSYVGPATFTMANNAAGAAGAVPLLDAYGTTTSGNYNGGSHYEYPSTSSSAPPGTWFPTPGDTGGPALGGVDVWTTQAAAPRDATHLCEALVTHQFMGATTSYYQIFTYGAQPSACTLEFWS